MVVAREPQEAMTQYSRSFMRRDGGARVVTPGRVPLRRRPELARSDEPAAPPQSGRPGDRPLPDGCPYRRGVSPGAHPVDLSLPLSVEEANLLLRGLIGYVKAWQDHYEEDGGRTHTVQEWEQVRVEVGRLVWRIEELAVLPGQRLRHSRYAVPPARPDDDEDGDDGGAGVREPRRPTPPAPTAAQDRDA